MKLWYMNDNHTFCELPHDVEAAIEIVRQQFAWGQKHGMLCARDNGLAIGSPFEDWRYAHGRGDFKEFEPRARAWMQSMLTYKSPADLEYESWAHVADGVPVPAPAQPVAWLHYDPHAIEGEIPWVLMVNQEHPLIQQKTERIVLHADGVPGLGEASGKEQSNG